MTLDSILSLNTEMISVILTGCFTLLGIFIGSYSSYRLMKKQEYLRLLTEFYAEVFSAYTAATPFLDKNKNMDLHAAIEKTKLLCSEDSAKILTDLQMEITSIAPSITACGDLLSKLRKSAKHDLHRI